MAIVGALGLLSYVGYQVVRYFYDPLVTETVMEYSIYDTIDTEGMAFRDETVLTDAGGGYLSFTVNNGSKVAKSETVADVFPTEADSRAGQLVSRLDESIAVLKEIELQGTSNHDKLGLTDRLLRQSIAQMEQDTSGARLTGMERWQSDLLELMNKRQMTIGKVVNFSDRIAELTAQRNQVAASAVSPTGAVRAPIAGYFSNVADGYESMMKIEQVPMLSAAQITDFMNNTTGITPPSGAVGKIVGNYQWYFACAVPSDQVGELMEGRSYDLLLPFVSRDAIPFTVKRINREGGGNVAVIFETNYMSGQLTSIRHELVQVRLRNYEGLRVPSQCVMTDSTGQKGVYIVVGDTIAYRKISVIHSEPDFVICEKEVHDADGKLLPDYLKIYDELVVAGKGLFDGKTVR